MVIEITIRMSALFSRAKLKGFPAWPGKVRYSYLDRILGTGTGSGLGPPDKVD